MTEPCPRCGMPPCRCDPPAPARLFDPTTGHMIGGLDLTAWPCRCGGCDGTCFDPEPEDHP